MVERKEEGIEGRKRYRERREGMEENGKGRTEEEQEVF